MRKSFKLIHGDSGQEYGTIVFNGKFAFDLADDIDINLWNKIGFIELGSSRHIESKDLFRHLNTRLPIQLREESSEKKIQYIEKTGLRVASDNFYLQRSDR